MRCKRLHMLETLTMIQKALQDEEMTCTIDKIKNSIAHAAPEILNRQWMKIYTFCVQHVNDKNNVRHQQCFGIYQKRFIEYESFFIES